MRGEYKVKNEGLKPLFLQACALVRKIGDVSFEHVRREMNTEADRLSNLGMDQAELALKSQS
jgi:ribonuclease HI